MLNEIICVLVVNDTLVVYWLPYKQIYLIMILHTCASGLPHRFSIFLCCLNRPSEYSVAAICVIGTIF